MDEELAMSRLIALGVTRYVAEDDGAEMLSSLLRTHLLCERALNAMLDLVITEQDVLAVERLSFAWKANLLCALGLVEKPELEALLAFNRLRNRIAHEFRAQVREEDLVRLIESLPPGWVLDHDEESFVKQFVAIAAMAGVQALMLVTFVPDRWQAATDVIAQRSSEDHFIDILFEVYGDKDVFARAVWREVNGEDTGDRETGGEAAGP